jgi:hypothetical protein
LLAYNSPEPNSIKSNQYSSLAILKVQQAKQNSPELKSRLVSNRAPSVMIQSPSGLLKTYDSYGLYEPTEDEKRLQKKLTNLVLN